MKWPVATTGALLAFGLTCSVQARASSEEEGASSAAPTSCVVEQFALRSYVTALRTGDTTTPARDPARLPQAITPLCRQAIESGRWPGLATELLSRVSGDPSLKKVICQLAPPEAFSAIIAWESKEDDDRSGYDVDCAVALFRHRTDDFKRIVWPRLSAGAGCAFSPVALQLGSALRPEERVALLPVLDFATNTRGEGRDSLYSSLCEHPAARTQAACQQPAALEPRWAREARVKRAVPWIAFHAGLALLFALAASLLWRSRREDWPAVSMGVSATMATSATITWILVSAPTPGGGALNGLNLVAAILMAPLVAVIAGAVAWASLRKARDAALPWCLLLAAIYGIVNAMHAWTTAWDQLC